MRERSTLMIAQAIVCAVLLSSVGSFLITSDANSGSPGLDQNELDEEDTPDIEETPPVAEVTPESDFVQFEATAYCDFGITFSGVVVQRGIVAADPSILPIGSVIEVSAGDYSGVYTVMDTGGVVKGRIIDIYVADYEEAMQFGRQSVMIRVIRRGWTPDSQFASSGLTVAG